MRDDSTIIIKGADKGSVVVIWDREGYLKEAYKQLEEKKVYEEVPNDPSVLVNTIIKALVQIVQSFSSNFKFVCAVICPVILILLLQIQNSLGFIFYPKFISVYRMYLVDQ